MFLPTEDGIICDFCGMSYKDRFTYYSLTTTIVKVINCMKVGYSDANFNKDMCQLCYDILINQNISNVICRTIIRLELSIIG